MNHRTRKKTPPQIVVPGRETGNKSADVDDTVLESLLVAANSRGDQLVYRFLFIVNLR